MKRIIATCLVISLLTPLASLIAREPVGVKPSPRTTLRTASDCLPPTATVQMDINNIRTLLHNGGDMWWDLVGDPRYEVPKGSGRHSLFAGSLWIGGIDESGQLRVAAQTYRQSGYDFWPGPLTNGSSSIDQDVCSEFDRMYKINKTEIDEFRAAFSAGEPLSKGKFPNVFAWPTGKGPENVLANLDGEIPETFDQDQNGFYLAPWVNVDSDPLNYNPADGDYPDIDGDQAIWWVINDKGNVHTETQGEPIGIEIHMLAFGFTTANAVNNMTFYKQKVINRSTNTLSETYLGQWVDADVGFFRDDYVGCDTTLGLGFCYNGDSDDEGANGYGTNPPAVGVDFFQGPRADVGDLIDNDKDGVVDEEGETIIMSKFIYYNNDFSLTGNPEVATHYYGYLSGFWKDGTPVVNNYRGGTGTGNGYGPSSPGDPTNFMFPGDPCAAVGWTEKNAGNPPADRRFIQSAGPFTLVSGAVNEVVTGVVWARGFYQDEIGSVCELKRADKIAQALFDSDFTLLDGPDAPEMAIAEFDRELILNWGYSEASRAVRNNYNESYVQADPVLKAQGVRDSIFKFQGYLIYQLIDQTVGPDELADQERARVVLQCDIKDGIGTIINRSELVVEGTTTPVIVDQVMVQGADNGILNSVRVTEDLFSQGDDKQLKNYTTYYYAAVAYANNDTASDGRFFIQGNRFFQVKSAVPHKVDFEDRGLVLNASYGDGIPVTQTAGVGNGGNFVLIDESTENNLLNAPYQENSITYQAGAAPIVVKVVDPKKVKGSYYRVVVTGRKYVEREVIGADLCSVVIDSTFAEWEVYEGSNAGGPFPDLIYQATFIDRTGGCLKIDPRPKPLTGTERVLTEHGISISVRNVGIAGDTLLANNGVIGATQTFVDEGQPWLSALPDNDDFGGGIFDWIKTGQSRLFKGSRVYDPNNDFSNLAGGWAPFCMTRAFNNDQQGGGQIAPGLPLGSVTTSQQMSVSALLALNEIPDVDIVITSDVSKWSRCQVMETSPNSNLGSGAWQLCAKWEDNIDDPNEIAKGPAAAKVARTPERHGWSWFPGYAVNVNTGERLNIFFGESTWDKANRGNDMIFNPTADFGSNLDRAGGRHYVWVTNQKYDEFASLSKTLSKQNFRGQFSQSIGGFIGNPDTTETRNLSNAYQYVAWAGIPILSPVFNEVGGPETFPTDTRISLRVNQPFRSRAGVNDQATFTFDTTPFAARKQEIEVAKTALDDILTVPNPYFGYSAYESGQLINTVKLTNLPQKCTISIFTLNGHLVRTFNKDSNTPDQNWDLKNFNGIPVSSGIYVIHIDGFDLGQKVIKTKVVMRAIDLNSF